MDKNFLAYQISEFKSLIELFNYEFTSQSQTYRLEQMVKTQYIEKKPSPFYNKIVEAKQTNDSNYFITNIALEYADILQTADNFEQVVSNFVKLYNAYAIYEKSKLGEFNFIDGNNYNRFLDIDIDRIGWVYNPDLDKTTFRIGQIELNKISSSSYYNFNRIAYKRLSFLDLSSVRTDTFHFIDPFKSLLVEQSNTVGIFPLMNFSWAADQDNKQIEFKPENEDTNYETKIVEDTNIVAKNNLLIKKLIDSNKNIDKAKSAEYNNTYIDKINFRSIVNANLDFIALSLTKDKDENRIKTGINIFFNKERTVSAVVNGYDLLYILTLMSYLESDDFCDFYLDSENQEIYILGGTKSSTKVQTGFDATTLTPIYDFLEIRTIFKLPVITTNYPSVVNELWLFMFSASSTIKEIIEFYKEDESVFKISIPTEFLNQKEILTKEQLFKIETTEEKIENLKVTGKNYLEKVVSYCEQFILTYADKIQETIIDESGNPKTIITYATKSNLPSTYLYDNVVNYDYVWKVNELFWKYNKNITIKELIAFFVAKGDQYNYRLLSYRILGIDCYAFKSKLTDQLLIESLLFIKDFKLNIETKNIEVPMELAYKYEYATGNYYEKRRKLRTTNTQGLSVLPMYESIELYYGEEIGSLIIQNHINLLENDMIKPKEMKWVSNDENSRLKCSPLDPIFISDNYGIKEVMEKGKRHKVWIAKGFYNFIQRTKIIKDVTIRQIELAYILRLPESVTIPLVFLDKFNCFKTAILPKENPLNTKGFDVFAVFGIYDLTNSNPLFIGQSNTDDKDCSEFIRSKPHGGSVALNRKRAGKYDGGTYLFSKQLKNLTSASYANLTEGGFITEQEANNRQIPKEKTQRIVNEILIAYNQQQAKVIDEGDYQFNKYMQTSVDEIDALKIQQVWNEVYNYEMYPKKNVKVEGFTNVVSKLNNEKFPIFIEHSRYFSKETQNEFRLSDNQIDGIKFYVGNKNCGLMAHEVGFGKTTTSICAISHQLLTGEGKRVMISVPNPVYIKFLREIKGEKTKDGYSKRGLTPQIDVVELKNSRKDVFLKYDKKTFTQTSGIKNYTLTQIKNIDSFRNVIMDIVRSVNPTKNVYKNLFFASYESNQSNIDDFTKFLITTFDNRLIDWRIEPFFEDIIKEVEDLAEERKTEWYDSLDELERLRDYRFEKIDDKTTWDDDIKDEKKKKVLDDFNTKAENKYNRLSREYTIDVVFMLKSKEKSIYDRIGSYTPEFLKSNSIVMSTHQAIGQLRVSEEIAKEVSYELKDNVKFSRALLNNPIRFDKLNVDSIIVDEIHNFNELFYFAKRQISKCEVAYRSATALRRENYSLNGDNILGISGLTYAKKRKGREFNNVIKFNIQGKATASQKATLYGICKGLHKKYNDSGKFNIMLLSATPFVDDLFQMMGVFNMLRPFETPIKFFANYTYQDWDWENDHKGETVLKVQTSNFKNDEARNNWIKLYAQFYTYDERINANRPNKMTYPYDCKSGNTIHYLDNCESNVYLDFSKEQYDIYQNIGKYLEGKIGYDAIVPSVKGKKIEVNLDLDPYILKTLKDYLDEDGEYYSPEAAVKEFQQNEILMKILKDKKNKDYQEIKDIFSMIEQEYNDAMGQTEEAIDEEDNEEERVVEDINDADSISGIGKEDGGTRALRGQDLGKKLALSPYMVTPYDAIDGNVNPNLPPLFGYNTLQEKSETAKNFIETSPKLYFIAKSIESTINYHRQRNESVMGQIIYISTGQKFTYGGVEYKSMELIKTYLENLLDMKKTFEVIETNEIEGANEVGKEDEKLGNKYVLSEIQIVSGSIADPLYKSAIANAFNEGKIKVLIGSSTIKEGIDLQGSKEFNHGNSTIYIATSDYAPMVYMQLEGRVWRQGNPLENVRMVYPLIKNSIDLHIYSKLKEKITKVKNMLEAGIYNFKETQFEKDIEGVSLVLNTNIEEKLKIIWTKYQNKIETEKQNADSIKQRLITLRQDYAKIEEAKTKMIYFYNAASQVLEDYYASTIIRQKWMDKSKSLKASYTLKRDDVAKKMSNLYDEDLKAYENAKEENEKINEENKKKKLPLIPFVLVKPLKKDIKYIPDYAEVELQQQKENLEEKQKIVNEVLQNIADKKYDEGEMYYHVELNSGMAYSEISQNISRFVSEYGGGTIGINVIRGNYDRITLSIENLTYYYAFSDFSKYDMMSYALQNKSNEDGDVTFSHLQNLLSDLGFSRGMSSGDNFVNVLTLFIRGGYIENTMMDYQQLVYSAGKTSADLDVMIDEKEDTIQELNIKLSEKSEFLSKRRNEFIEEDERIKKEREKLTELTDYIMGDVDKFAKTNKFIYMRGSLTEEQKNQMFIKKQ